jgi:hypothetical protein
MEDGQMVWGDGTIKWKMGKWYGVMVQLNGRWANGMEWWDN